MSAIFTFSSESDFVEPAFSPTRCSCALLSSLLAFFSCSAEGLRAGRQGSRAEAQAC